jgi:hypothetical protein
VKQLFLVHGIDRALKGMQDHMAELGYHNIAIPQQGQRFVL